MDREAATAQMRTLYGKAKTARADGKRALAKAFRQGGDRIKRRIASVSRIGTPSKKKTEE